MQGFNFTVILIQQQERIAQNLLYSSELFFHYILNLIIVSFLEILFNSFYKKFIIYSYLF